MLGDIDHAPALLTVAKGERLTRFAPSSADGVTTCYVKALLPI